MDRMRSIMYQYFKYANVYVYIMEDGNLITLPVHLVRIANIMVDGEPVVELNCRTIKDDMSQTGAKAQKDFVEDDDLMKKLEGYPPEVADAVKANKEWVQLNPENTFVLQDLKEDWMRYAVPMVATALSPLARKALIGQYEGALLNLGIRSFVHVTYGDPKEDVMPDINALNQVNNLFRRAMTGNALATTNHLVKAAVVQPDTKNMFDHDKYREVNAEILSAGGISGIIVSGRAEDGSNFASAQVSMQTAAMRIKQARDNFCELMNRVNQRLNGSGGGVSRSASTKVPKFTFPPVDLAGNEKFQKTCYTLWKDGVLSTQTVLQVHGYDLDQEVERMKSEQSGDISSVMQRPSVKPESTAPEPGGKLGRPEMDDTERNSDPAKSSTGAQPKPSRPEGSG